MPILWGPREGVCIRVVRPLLPSPCSLMSLPYTACLSLCRFSLSIGLGEMSLLSPRSDPGCEDNAGLRPWFDKPVLWGPCVRISESVVRQILG